MDEFICIAFVPRRVLNLYEAVYAYPKDVCDMAEEDIRLADEARESEHHDAQHFMHMYENQDMCGAIKVIVVDGPALDRLYRLPLRILCKNDLSIQSSFGLK